MKVPKSIFDKRRKQVKSETFKADTHVLTHILYACLCALISVTVSLSRHMRVRVRIRNTFYIQIQDLYLYLFASSAVSRHDKLRKSGTRQEETFLIKANKITKTRTTTITRAERKT